MRLFAVRFIRRYESEGGTGMPTRGQTIKGALGALFFVGLMIITALPAVGEDDYQLGQEYWNQGSYREAYTHLMRYREGLYGRIAHVDYMLGTSGCRLEDLRGWGCEVLEWMLYRYALSEQARDLVKKELTLCRSAGPVPGNISPESLKVIASLIGASARASGKTYYWLGRDDIFNSYPAYRVREIPKQEMAARLIPLGSRDRALSATQARVTGFKVVPYDRFVLATRSGHSMETLNKMALYLERYLTFLEREYGITLPATYVTVYMVPTSDDLVKVAQQLHGIKVSRATFGYSFRDDMSVIAAIPKEFLVGTIMHEFFHLAVRSHFGDVPQWLDEGMAGLYEVSKFEGDTVMGLPNWRGKVLSELMKRQPGIRPSIRQLITSDWFAFEQYEYVKALQRETEGESPPAEQMAAMLATARYFTLYLQHSGKLKPVYQDLQKLTPGGRAKDPATESIAMIEGHLGRPIDRIDSDFLVWFKQVEKGIN